eukprot:TRINITY_DN3083_c0_g1_i1.p1 TRINITY_DN3083_c0_g1~~TRINITY_DN3083_c0_g1_i1.p1  ORF type:complete len:291 (-),score=23.55 TRINITY_DN3083_c0_g1_i1:422-1294(-)
MSTLLSVQDSDDAYEQSIKTIHKPQTNIIGSTVLMVATILGAGILTTPRTYQFVGIGLCTFILLFIGLLNWYSIYMLVEAAAASKSETYEELVHKAIPRYGKYLVAFFFIISLFGTLTSFALIIAGLLSDVAVYIVQQIPSLAGHTGYWFTDKAVLLLIFSCVSLFPLSMLRNISKLEYSSFVAILIVIVFTGVIMVKSITKIHAGEVNWQELKYASFAVGDVFETLPILALAYACQTNILIIQSELAEPTSRRMNFVNIAGNLVSATMYILMGFFWIRVVPERRDREYL